MKILQNSFFPFTLIFCALISRGWASVSDDPWVIGASPLPNGALSTRPLVYFEENKGQIRDQSGQARPDILFSGDGGGFRFFLLKNGISYQQYKVEIDRAAWASSTRINSPDDATALSERVIIYRTDIRWVNANPEPVIEKINPLPDYNHYYNVPLGSEPALFVRSFGKVIFRNLWEGVDAEFYEGDKALETDWVVQDVKFVNNIILQISGAELSTDGKNLFLKTPFGTFAEGAINAIQDGKELDCRWVVEGSQVKVKVEGAVPGIPLRIDPPVLLWGTYYGGALSEAFLAGNLDVANGFYYGCGRTSSTTAIATSGAHQTSIHTQPDAFLVKFTTGGTRLWGTYYGGNNNDFFLGCAPGLTGEIYVVGATFSNVNISTSGSHQSAYGGGLGDAMFVKFDGAGVRQWATYYGGTGLDDAQGCGVDSNGDVYISGVTTTTTAGVISTPGSHQQTKNNMQDAYLAKFTSAGVRLWGTYYGGNSNDRSFSLRVAPDNHVYMIGLTASNNPGNEIATPGTHKTSVNGEDAFLVKFTSAGTRVWGTYYGGPQIEHPQEVAVDNDGNVYICGLTNSSTGIMPNAIATPGTHQSVYGAGTIGGTTDAFLAKFNGNNGTLMWGTFFGGDGEDQAYSCTVDQDGNIIMAGYTESTVAIATPGSFQTSLVGVRDGFVARFFASNGTLDFGTYFGGNNLDDLRACNVDGQGHIMVSGYTNSSTGIATPGAHQTSIGTSGIDDGVIARICRLTNTFYQDADGDGYGNPSVTTIVCSSSPPPGYVANNTDCNDSNPSIHSGASEICLNAVDDNCNSLIDEGCLTKLQASDCNSTINAFMQVLVVDSMPGAIYYHIRITDGTNTWFLLRPKRGFYLAMLPGLQYGTTYNVDVRWSPDSLVWSDWGPVCLVTTPNTAPLLRPSAATCSLTMTSYPHLIKSETYPFNYYWLPTPLGTHAEIYGATQYQFDFLATSPTTHQVTVNTAPPSGRNYHLNLGAGLRWGTQYRLRIRSFVPSLGWSAWGDSCHFTTPPIPLTQLQVGDCGATITSKTQVFRAIAMHQASQYEFKLIDANNHTWYALRPNRGCYLKLFGPSSWPAGTYTIQVRWKTSYGEWSPWGPTCTLNLPVSLHLEDENITDQWFDVRAFPNPFMEDFALTVETFRTEPVLITVWDAHGREVESLQVPMEHIGLLTLGEGWATGMYAIRVQQGTEVRTLRVVKASL